MKFSILSIAIFFALTSGCRKAEQLDASPEAKLHFSAERISFDTVFTGLTSTSQRLQVYNRSKDALKISEIRLLGGASSVYKININGVASETLKDFIIHPKDSINVFVKVSILPNASISPFDVNDTLQFKTNGNVQKVALNAVGQNVEIVRDGKIVDDIIWTNIRPYLIFGTVKVAAGKTLTVQHGARLLFNKDAELLIEGSLKVEGLPGDEVLFGSSRLEEIYANEPGQWKGIRILSTSQDNMIRHAIIRNAAVGLQVESSSPDFKPKLILANSVIRSMQVTGMKGLNSDISAFNNLITDCGRHLVHCSGGRYDFKQNTLVNSGIFFSRDQPSVLLSDNIGQGRAASLSVDLVNNIIWGNLRDELSILTTGSAITLSIRKNIVRTNDLALVAGGNILNEDPQFRDIRANNYRLNQNSRALNKGESLASDPYFTEYLNRDLSGIVRLFPSELGCYELL